MKCLRYAVFDTINMLISVFVARHTIYKETQVLCGCSVKSRCKVGNLDSCTFPAEVICMHGYMHLCIHASFQKQKLNIYFRYFTRFTSRPIYNVPTNNLGIFPSLVDLKTTVYMHFQSLNSHITAFTNTTNEGKLRL